MAGFGDAFAQAAGLVLGLDGELMGIVALSLAVSLSATALACLVGLPLGALLAVTRFRGRGAAVAVLNALMGLPPVVVGLSVYLLVSASGPLGPLRLLYTPAAMILAQAILVTPIVAALTRETVAALDAEYDEYLRTLGAGPLFRVGTLLWDGRFALTTAALAGLGRALAEVGAVMIVGGNIAHVTRVMTTAIALETSKGELAMALALGAILVTLSLAVTAAVTGVRLRAEAAAHA
ncbi:MAG: ABC transporter permease [Paracoccaceae bacterium]